MNPCSLLSVYTICLFSEQRTQISQIESVFLFIRVYNLSIFRTVSTYTPGFAQNHPISDNQTDNQPTNLSGG